MAETKQFKKVSLEFIRATFGESRKNNKSAKSKVGQTALSKKRIHRPKSKEAGVGYHPAS